MEGYMEGWKDGGIERWRKAGLEGMERGTDGGNGWRQG